MQKKSQTQSLAFRSSPDWTRTSDQVINSHLLYQLSYRGIFKVKETLNLKMEAELYFIILFVNNFYA